MTARAARPAARRSRGEPPLAVEVGGRTVELSRPGKLLFPAVGVTKADVASYYVAVADAMLPHLRDRPLNLQRFPDGVDGPGFLQQEASPWFPRSIRRIEVPKRGGTVAHPAVRHPADLVYLTGQAAIVLHAWTSRADRLDRPDRLVFDLDPARDDFAEVRAVARELGELLCDLGLEPFAMTTGSRGVHVTVPLQRRAGYDEVAPFARAVARLLADRHPDRLTVEQRKAKREQRMFLDVGRTRYAHTAVAPYSVRARPAAPVATPLAWEELSDRRLRPDGWTVETLPARLAERGDPWAGIARSARPLAAAARRLERSVA